MAAAASVRDSEKHYHRVLSLTEEILKSEPKLTDTCYSEILSDHTWWLREADRHATHGFYDGGEFVLLGVLNSVHLSDDALGQAERRLESLIVQRRFVHLYDSVRSAACQLELFGSQRLDLNGLCSGAYARIRDDMDKIRNDAFCQNSVEHSIDVLLPRSIQRMNYPFSYHRGLKLPPSPADLRVLFDWHLDFHECFDWRYLIDIRHQRGIRGKGVKKFFVNDSYMRHYGCSNAIENWILDLAESNHTMQAQVTFNGTQNRIDFAVRQRNMHKKHWHFKAQKVEEYCSSKHPMICAPNELYNAARRAIRRTHTYLHRKATEFGMAYHAFPPAMNP
jgi:hypothetical protein